MGSGRPEWGKICRRVKQTGSKMQKAGSELPAFLISRIEVFRRRRIEGLA
jgi:hypothetical protein